MSPPSSPPSAPSAPSAPFLPTPRRPSEPDDGRSLSSDESPGLSESTVPPWRAGSSPSAPCRSRVRDVRVLLVELVGLHVIRLARHLVRLAPGPLALVGLLVLLVARRILAHDADADRVLAIAHAVRVLPGRRLHVVRLARRDRLELVVHRLLVHLGHHFRRGLIRPWRDRRSSPSRIRLMPLLRRVGRRGGRLDGSELHLGRAPCPHRSSRGSWGASRAACPRRRRCPRVCACALVMDHLERSYDLRAGLAEDSAMMWSGSRSTRRPRASERVERAGRWCWYSSCVENCVPECLCRALWCAGTRKMKGARTWHLVNLPEQDAELVLFLWFKNNKTLTMSCVLFPSSLDVSTCISFCKRRGFNSSRQIRTMRHVVTGCVRCNGVLNIHDIHRYSMNIWTSAKKIPACHCHDVRTASLAESSRDGIVYKTLRQPPGRPRDNNGE